MKVIEEMAKKADLDLSTRSLKGKLGLKDIVRLMPTDDFTGPYSKIPSGAKDYWKIVHSN